MKICTTTLLGPGTCDHALEAIESARRVGITDHVIVPWNAFPEDVAATNAFQQAEPYVGSSFGEARNWALGEAERLRFDWAVTLDTDERLLGEGLPRWLDQVPKSDKVLSVSSAVGATYSKPRVFRLQQPRGFGGSWVGRTHEAFVASPAPSQIPPSVLSFSELPKTSEQLRRKAERDVELLTLEITDDPTDGRWWFYLGESYTLLNDPYAAVSAYEACYVQRSKQLPPVSWADKEEGAWAMFKAARVIHECDPDAAVEHCMRGMALYPFMAELPWFAAFVRLGQGRENEALSFAQHAAILGDTLKQPWAPARHGFRELVASWEGPLEITAAATQDPDQKSTATEAANRLRARRPAI